MKKKKDISLFKDEKKCALCGRQLRYFFELESGVCEKCQIGKNQKIKTFEQFTYNKK
ncbi:MAG: hypothetical protein HPY57_15565 [Ignavibacteria bacterium]|nr:hypothetical protein [Ignavibacteria bacterium]